MNSKKNWVISARIFRQLLGPIIALLAIVGVMSQANAQTPEYLAEYHLYEEALKFGDTEQAERHSYAAWQAAERELGDHRLTAILAFNYGQLIILTSPQKARTALLRAQSVNAVVNAGLPTDELRALLAFIDLETGGNNRNTRKALHTSLNTYMATTQDPTQNVAVIWLRLAAAYIEKSEFEDAALSAEAAEKALATALPYNFRLRAQAIIIHGVAMVAPFSNSPQMTEIGVNDLARAQDFFPKQPSLDSFDLLLAQAIAWEVAGYAKLQSQLNMSYVGRAGHGRRGFSPQRIFEGKTKSDAQCNITMERSELEFPRPGVHKNYVGGVLVGFNLSTTGEVIDARVLSEVPSQTYGPATLKVVKQWRSTTKPLNDPACLKNHMMTAAYILLNR